MKIRVEYEERVLYEEEIKIDQEVVEWLEKEYFAYLKENPSDFVCFQDFVDQWFCDNSDWIHDKLSFSNDSAVDYCDFDWEWYIDFELNESDEDESDEDESDDDESDDNESDDINLCDDDDVFIIPWLDYDEDDEGEKP